jgi:hypothetical protein
MENRVASFHPVRRTSIAVFGRLPARVDVARARARDDSGVSRRAAAPQNICHAVVMTS